MKKPTLHTIAILVLYLCMSFTTNYVDDIDGVTIGSQTWATKNLDVTNFKNGDPIKQVTSDMEWLMADVNKEPAWCYFNFDEANNETFGKLYNGHAVLDKRGLAPKGWRIPSDADFKSLEAHIGKNGNQLKADNPTNNGFSAVYSGSINTSGSFMGEYFMVWTNTKVTSTSAFYRMLNNYNSEIYRKAGKLGAGYAVRCIK